MGDAKTVAKVGGNQAKGNPKSVEAQDKVGNVRSSGTIKGITGTQRGLGAGLKRRS